VVKIKVSSEQQRFVGVAFAQLQPLVAISIVISGNKILSSLSGPHSLLICI